jgi:hypothetical protein
MMLHMAYDTFVIIYNDGRFTDFFEGFDSIGIIPSRNIANEGGLSFANRKAI